MFCSECGAALKEQSSFCPLCGAPQAAGQPQQAGQPQSTGQPQTASHQQSAGQPQSMSQPQSVGQRRGPSRRGATAIVPAVVGAVGLIAVAVLLAKGLGGTSGADSPIAAVRQLAAAAETADPAAAISVIDPGETQGLSAAYSKVRDAFKASGALRTNGSVAGMAVKFEGLRLSEQRLGPEVAKVAIAGGTLKTADSLKGLDPGAAGPSSSTTDLATAKGPSGPDSPGDGLFLIVRRHAGRWYVSPVMTALQYLVDTQGLPQPDFSKLTAGGNGGQAASNPEQLANALGQAVSDEDVEALIGLMSEEEASALRPYSAALQQLVSQAGGSAQLRFTNPQLTETPLEGGLERLDISHLGFEASVSGDEESEVPGGRSASGTINGPCVETVSAYGSRSHGCFSQIQRVLGVNDLFVVARRSSAGRLRLAPVATLMTYVRMFLEQLGGAGMRRMFGTVVRETPAGTLASGVRLSGSLNSAGYATLAYHAAAPGLLAVDSNQNAVVLNQDGEEAQRLACPDGSELYQLGSAGSYRVLVAAGGYSRGSYWVVAEPVQPQNASVPSRVSGSIGSGARLAVLAVDLPTGGTSFQTGSPVLSTFAGPVDGPYDACSAPSAGQILGSQALLHPSEVRPAPYPPAGGGSSEEQAYGSDSRYYLVISGAPEARFSGELAVGSSYPGG